MKIILFLSTFVFFLTGGIFYYMSSMSIHEWNIIESWNSVYSWITEKESTWSSTIDHQSVSSISESENVPQKNDLVKISQSWSVILEWDFMSDIPYVLESFRFFQDPEKNNPNNAFRILLPRSQSQVTKLELIPDKNDIPCVERERIILWGSWSDGDIGNFGSKFSSELTFDIPPSYVQYWGDWGNYFFSIAYADGTVENSKKPVLTFLSKNWKRGWDKEYGWIQRMMDMWNECKLNDSESKQRMNRVDRTYECYEDNILAFKDTLDLLTTSDSCREMRSFHQENIQYFRKDQTLAQCQESATTLEKKLIDLKNTNPWLEKCISELL